MLILHQFLSKYAPQWVFVHFENWCLVIVYSNVIDEKNNSISVINTHHCIEQSTFKRNPACFHRILTGIHKVTKVNGITVMQSLHQDVQAAPRSDVRGQGVTRSSVTTAKPFGIPTRHAMQPEPSARPVSLHPLSSAVKTLQTVSFTVVVI